MAAQPLSPPPLSTAVASGNGLPSSAWGQWFQRLFTKLSGAWIPAKVIVATSISPTTDFGALAAGDKVLVLPAAAGNSSFVTVATDGTLPVPAVVGSLYVVLRGL